MDLKEGMIFAFIFLLEVFLTAVIPWTRAPPLLTQNNVNTTLSWLWQSNLLCIEEGDLLLKLRKQSLSSSTEKKSATLRHDTTLSFVQLQTLVQSGFSPPTVVCITNKICMHLLRSPSPHTTGSWIV